MPGCVAEAGEVKIVKDLGDGLTITNHRDGTELCMTAKQLVPLFIQHKGAPYEIMVTVQHHSGPDDRIGQLVKSLATKVAAVIVALGDPSASHLSKAEFARMLRLDELPNWFLQGMGYSDEAIQQLRQELGQRPVKGRKHGA